MTFPFHRNGIYLEYVDNQQRGIIGHYLDKMQMETQSYYSNLLYYSSCITYETKLIAGHSKWVFHNAATLLREPLCKS